jgi:hypothetical protein
MTPSRAVRCTIPGVLIGPLIFPSGLSLGTEFSFSLSGDEFSGSINEVLLSGGSAGANVLRLQNTSAGGYSAITFQGSDNHTYGAIGYGNASSVAPFAGSTFWESPVTSGSPKPIRIILTGTVAGVSAFHVKQEFTPAGDIVWYKNDGAWGNGTPTNINSPVFTVFGGANSAAAPIVRIGGTHRGSPDASDEVCTLQMPDENFAIEGRWLTGGIATKYFCFGGTSASGAGHKFYSGGVRASQTLKFQIADDSVVIGGGSSSTELRILEPSASGTNYTGFVSPALAANVVYTMPTADATVSGQVLSSNASKVLSWVTAGTYTGTANQVIVTGSVLSLPQDIGLASDVTFGSIDCEGAFQVGGIASFTGPAQFLNAAPPDFVVGLTMALGSVNLSVQAGELYTPGIFYADLGYRGMDDNAASAAGVIGEIKTATLASGSATSLTSGTAKTITSITLTAGSWDVFGVVDYIPAATTTTAFVQQGANTTTNALGAADTFTACSGGNLTGTVLGSLIAENIPAQRISVNGNTVVYLVAKASFAVSTMTAYGTIWASRAH